MRVYLSESPDSSFSRSFGDEHSAVEDSEGSAKSDEGDTEDNHRAADPKLDKFTEDAIALMQDLLLARGSRRNILETSSTTRAGKLTLSKEKMIERTEEAARIGGERQDREANIDQSAHQEPYRSPAESTYSSDSGQPFGNIGDNPSLNFDRFLDDGDGSDTFDLEAFLNSAGDEGMSGSNETSQFDDTITLGVAETGPDDSIRTGALTSTSLHRTPSDDLTLGSHETGDVERNKCAGAEEQGIRGREADDRFGSEMRTRLASFGFTMNQIDAMLREERAKAGYAEREPEKVPL